MTDVNYAGGGWSGDWYEHYERALLFDGQRPLDYQFSHRYELTARPPFFNVIACFYMTLVGFQFSDYQIVATFLGLLVLVPASLIFRRALGDGGSHRTGDAGMMLLVSILLVLHPMVSTNIIYPWTRMLTNALVLMGLYLHAIGLFGHRGGPLALSALCLGAAHLAHYSADVVVVVLAGHLVFSALRGRGPRWRTLAGAGACALMLNAVWYVRSVSVYGAQRTPTSNSTWANIKTRPLAELAAQLIAPNVEQSGIVYLALQPISVVLFLLAVASIARTRAWWAGLFTVAYGIEALLFHYLKTLQRVTPAAQSLFTLYTETYYDNLRLKLVYHKLRFLSNTYPGLVTPSRVILLVSIPVLCAAGGWLSMRVCAPAARVEPSSAR